MADPALTDYLPPACGQDGCDELGPFPTDDGPRCFMHAGFAPVVPEGSLTAGLQADDQWSPKAPRKRKGAVAPAEDMNDTAARALAALILTATADALTTDTAKMERAIIELASDLPAPLEVAAAILFATTAISGTAGLTDQEVFVIGAAFEDQAAEESAAPTDDGADGADAEPIERGDDGKDGS